MYINFEDYLSYSYIENETLDMIEEEYKKGKFEIYLPAALGSKVEEEDIISWFGMREKIFYTYLYGALNDEDLLTVINYLDYHYQKYLERKGNGLPFLFFIQELLQKVPVNGNERQQTILEWIDIKKKELNQHSLDVKQSETRISEKIKWEGSPSVFGYVMTELVKQGFIEPPLYNGEPNFTGLAKLCFLYFNVNETTLENLIKEMNPNKCTLSDTKRAKFTIPNISDLG